MHMIGPGTVPGTMPASLPNIWDILILLSLCKHRNKNITYTSHWCLLFYEALDTAPGCWGSMEEGKGLVGHRTL